MRAIDVANYLVERWGRCYPATIHKLNRLVYLVQVEAIATTGGPLFEDCIEAWQCGPVVPAVIHAFAKWGDAVIAEPIEHVEIKPDAARLIDSVAEHFDISKPSLSHHLATLRNAGLVTDERHGQNIVYSLNTTVMQDLVGWFMGFADDPEDRQ